MSPVASGAVAAFACRWCPRRFVRIDHLRRHETSHTKERSFRCWRCDKLFSRHDAMLRHLTQVHGVPIEDRYAVPQIPSTAPPDPLVLGAGQLPASPAAEDEQEQQQQQQQHGEGSEISAGSGGGGSSRRMRTSIATIGGGAGASSSAAAAVSSSTATTTTVPVLPSMSPLAPHRRITGEHTENWQLPPANAFPQWRASATSILSTHSLPDYVMANTPAVIIEGTVMNMLAGDPQHRLNPSSLAPFPARPLGPHSLLERINAPYLFARYHAHYNPKLPFIHIPSLDLSSALRLEFPESAVTTQSSINAELRPFHRSLFVSMLALGAVIAMDIEIARKLYDETATSIRADLAAMQRLGYAYPPLSTIQAILNYILVGIMFGERRIRTNSLTLVCSLVSLVNDAHLSARRRRRVPLAELASCSHTQWLEWVQDEESKRTFFAVLWTMNAMLTAFSSIPSPELNLIELDLPCLEYIWCAEDVQTFRSRVHAQPAGPISFKEAYISLFQPSDPSRARLIGEFGVVALVAALNRTVWTWAKHQGGGEESSGSTNTVPNRATATPQDQSEKRLLEKYTRASHMAHALWNELWTAVPGVDVTISSEMRLLAMCKPVIENIQLMLIIHIYSDKDALRAQNYDTNGSKLILGIHTNSLIDAAASIHPNLNLNRSQQVVEQNSNREKDVQAAITTGNLFGAAVYAAAAIELELSLGPWWLPNNMAVDLPLSSAVSVFHYIQLLCSWLITIQGKAVDMETKQSRVSGLVQTCRNLIDRSRNLFQVPSLTLHESAVPVEIAWILLRIHAQFYNRKSALPVLGALGTSMQERANALLKEHGHSSTI